MNVLVFSKNRACQLELLLRSALLFSEELFSAGIKVIYTASSEDYAKGYRTLKISYPTVTFIDQGASTESFKELIILHVDPLESSTMFLVDDDVFINKLTVGLSDIDRFLVNDSRLTSISLRMSPSITECYPLGGVHTPPPVLAGNVWQWVGSSGDWGYPASLDGNVFRTKDIIPILSKLEYNTPNTLESRMANHIELPGDSMYCFDRSVLVNVPLNLVQEGFNRNAGGDPAWLNSKFLSGSQISLDGLSNFVPRAPHAEVPLTLVDSSVHSVKGSCTFIDGDAFEALSNNNLPGIVFTETDNVLRAVTAQSCVWEPGKVFITHNSDHNITSELASYILDNQNYRPPSVWFAQNCTTEHKSLVPVPIGLERVRWFPHLRKRDILLAYMKKISQCPTKLCLANFSIETNRLERTQAREAAVRERVTLGFDAQVLTKDYTSYLESVLDHHFVMCPEGNGVDTHRLWEVLYMGRIPVVTGSPLLKGFDGLPLLVIDSWGQFSTEILLAFLHNLRAHIFEYSTEKLDFMYWQAKILFYANMEKGDNHGNL